jgi:hypothetical protein
MRTYISSLAAAGDSCVTSLGVFTISWKESIPRAQHLVRILVTVEGEVSTSPTLRFLFLPFFDDMRRAFGCGLLGESVVHM